MSGLRIWASVALLGLGAMALRLPAVGGSASNASRLRKHFAVVERELLARDVSALKTGIKEGMAQSFERLTTYLRKMV